MTGADGDDIGVAHITVDEDGDVTLPVVDLLTGRGFITGKSGSGKSNTASVVVEELLDGGYPVLIVDTDGEYWGLKEDYEILHVGADEECDLQVGPEHAEKLAELALEKNIPIILDVSGYLDRDTADELVRKTAQQLFVREKTLKKPFLMIVEEIHEYIPQSGGRDETGEMLVRVGKRGRKRGLGIAGISQRPAQVDKDFITQCDWLVWHRLTWDNDTSVVRDVLGSGYDEEVKELADGEGFVRADWMGEIRRVQFRRKRTFDAGETPDLGEFERPDLKSVGDDLLGDLEEISEREERRQDEVARLEAELEEREETIADLRDELEQAKDMTDMAEQFSEALVQSASGSNGDSEAINEKINEIREEKNARITELEQENETLREELRGLREEREGLQERVGELEEYEQAVGHMDDLREAVVRMNEALGYPAGADDDELRAELKEARQRIDELESRPDTVETDVLSNTKVERFLNEMGSRLSGLDDKERGMLRFYMIEGPATSKDAYKYVGGSPTSSRRNKKTKTLRNIGLVEKVSQGQYDYSAQKCVEDRLGEHFDDGEVDAVVQEVESMVDDAVMGGVENGH